MASARTGKGMFNMPPLLHDVALTTLDGIRDDEFQLGAQFWSEGFRDIAGLYVGQVYHLAEHVDDVRCVVPRFRSLTSTTHLAEGASGAMSTPDFEVHRTAARLAAASAVLGALLALVVNPIHGDLPADPEAALTRVAASGSWGLLHLGIMASVVFILGGLFGLSQVADGPLARALARLSLVVALPGAAVMLVGIAIDGFATKALADLWATASPADRATAFRMVLAVEEVQNALFHTWAALFIGLPFLLLGLSGSLAGGGFPRWLGVIAMVGGAGALGMGVCGFLYVPVPGVLFNLFAFLVTLWALVAGVLVWRAPARPGVALLEAASAA